MRTIGVVTVGRSDYGIYLPLLRRIQDDPDLRLGLIVSGSHLSPEFGHTVDLIGADGFKVEHRVEMLLSSDSPEGIAKSMGLGVLGFGQLFGHFRPDILVVLGDRFEMFAAALAALPFKIPVAHLHGGEVTQGAMDEALRHAMTKLSHLHFVSAEPYASRVVQLGEEPWRVTVTGAPGLENLDAIEFLDRQLLAGRFGLSVIADPFLLVTYHPVTLEYEQAGEQIAALLSALATLGRPVVFTMPNADTHGRVIRQAIQAFIAAHPRSQALENLGTPGYFSLMKLAQVMVGNSSSGIIEAASFELPVVNIGNRQAGRVRGANVIDVGYNSDEILAGIQAALSPAFRARLVGLANPYRQEDGTRKIVEILKTIPIDQKLIVKYFHDLGIP